MQGGAAASKLPPFGSDPNTSLSQLTVEVGCAVQVDDTIRVHMTLPQVIAALRDVTFVHYPGCTPVPKATLTSALELLSNHGRYNALCLADNHSGLYMGRSFCHQVHAVEVMNDGTRAPARAKEGVKGMGVLPVLFS